MTSIQKTLYGLDKSKYPARMGQAWNEEEDVKLLKSIRKKISIEEISKEHERTVGGIRSHIRQLAADYYFNDKRPIEEIEKFTGLTKAEIEDVIKKRQMRATTKEPIEIPSQPTTVNLTAVEVLSTLKEIQTKVNTLIETIECSML